MNDFLIFTVYAPLASWGEIAVGEVRGSWDRPSRSAILGLVAGALGVVRDDQDGHDALDAGYGVGVRLDLPGSAIVDYHTTQTVAESIVKKRKPATRADLLSAGERQTILSRRAYRQDALATVALWARSSATWPLATLVMALRRPVFVPFAGRKANALGLPLAPTIVSAPTLGAAFAQRPAGARGEILNAIVPASGWGREVAHDACDQFDSGLRLLRHDVRRDRRAQRTRWQFAERIVHISVLESEGRVRSDDVAGFDS